MVALISYMFFEQEFFSDVLHQSAEVWHRDLLKSCINASDGRN